jgi:diguanylate cyclase (GGDEF)-like protein
MNENLGRRIKNIHTRLRREFSVIAIIWVVIFGATFYYYTYEVKKILINEQETRLKTIVDSFSSSLKSHLVTGNVSAIEELSVRLVEQFDGAIVSVFRATGDNLIIASNNDQNVALSYATDAIGSMPIRPETRVQKDGMTTLTPVRIGASIVSYVKLQLLNSDYDRIYSAILKRLLLLLSLLLLLGFAIYAFLTLRLSNNIIRSLTSFRDAGRRDTLTSLPNRAAIYDYLNQKTSDSALDDSIFSVCFVDLNKLKAVNDTLGHVAGDALIKETAGRLNSALRTDDFLGRLAGDEFIIILNGVGDRKGLEPIILRINAAVDEEFIFERTSLRPSVCIGVSVFPKHGRTGTELIQSADKAMYDLKRESDYRKKKFKIYTD